MATFTETGGLIVIAKRYNGVDSLDPMTYIELEKDNTPESASHTALISPATETGLTRAAATCGYEATGKATWEHDFTNGTASTVAIWGWGVFNAASAGLMGFRHVFAAVQNVLAGATLTTSGYIVFA